MVSGEGKRKARRALSLELQLDDDMDAKKDRTVAFEDLLSKALTFFGQYCVYITGRNINLFTCGYLRRWF